jgi:F-type H+-transporting ATPase subunit b
MKSTGLSATRRAPRAAALLAAATVIAPAHAHAAGLNLFPDMGLVGMNVLLFVLLIYPVNRLLVQPLLAVLDERERRTAGAESEVEALRSSAREARSALEAGLVQARARAQARRTAILSAGETDERALLDAARNDAMQNVESVRNAVQSELDAARAALESDTRALAREAASRILGRAL